MLEIRDLKAWYGRTQALFGVSFRLEAGQSLALIGTNGAGKTTTIRAILGLVPTEGDLLFDGRDISGQRTPRRVSDNGIAVVHEGRGMFQRMTVRENILVGLPHAHRGRLAEALDLFPTLRNRLDEPVSQLSGGQQQMVAIARAVTRRPRLFLLDEPSLGLAPAVVDEIYGYLSTLRQSGLTMLLVEQSVPRAIAFADNLCLIRTGRSISTVGSSDKANVDQLVQIAFGNEPA